MNNAAELLKELVSINSVNPDLVPGAAGEIEIAVFCTQWLAARGFEVHRLEERKGRPSVVGIAKGRGGGRSLMFNGHLDTVTHAGYDGDPLRAEAGRRKALRPRLLRHEERGRRHDGRGRAGRETGSCGRHPRRLRGG